MNSRRAASVDALGLWRDNPWPSRQRGRRAVEQRQGLLRFAFYGRLSTKEHQDPETSWRWQLECAGDLVEGVGTIVAQFLDVGFSRRRSWQLRAQAAALLSVVASDACPFDAVVVGEYERAFCGRQVFEIAEALRARGVQLWLPETLGPVDLDDPAHRAVLIELGARSLREVQRSRRRATEAMRVQTRYQGRYLGGRPPYGYRLVDAGPHPNASQARWGRQLQCLDPDPATAGHVRWIFARRLEGDSMAAIARSLNERGVPCPSAQDPARNQHRRARGWSVTTVAAILANPRYTGRQVWNRQATRYRGDTTLDSGGTGAPVRGRNTRPDWVISERPAHPALVSEADFIAAQHVSALSVPAHGERRCYLLVGVLRCAICERRMTAHWAHGRAWYRCRHGITSATPADSGRPRTLYLREDRLIQDITVLLREHGLPDPPTGSALAAYLKQRTLMIACSWQSTTLEHDQPGRAGSDESRDLGHDRAR